MIFSIFLIATVKAFDLAGWMIEFLELVEKTSFTEQEIEHWYKVSFNLELETKEAKKSTQVDTIWKALTVDFDLNLRKSDAVIPMERVDLLDCPIAE